ncbi:MAG TPA: uracil phosphoribosyltransferase [Methanocorpusculum sp.]|nr:uracil phosphoribosyltransferase [Methanocorpusculum sp.]
MSTVHVTYHPLIQHKLSMMRDKNTGAKDFRELLNELSMLMGYEVTQNLETKTVEIETPICKTQTHVLKEENIVIVPILRAGLGMTDGLLSLMPFAKVGHIGLYRDETTHEPVEYYCKLPKEAATCEVILVDPMLATGGSAAAAIGFLKEHGCKNIRLMCLVAAPRGISVVQKAHQDVDIYVASIDESLNENCYIVPGLGDAGDRIFGTK